MQLTVLLCHCCATLPHLCLKQLPEVGRVCLQLCPHSKETSEVWLLNLIYLSLTPLSLPLSPSLSLPLSLLHKHHTPLSQLSVLLFSGSANLCQSILNLSQASSHLQQPVNGTLLFLCIPIVCVCVCVCVCVWVGGWVGGCGCVYLESVYFFSSVALRCIPTVTPCTVCSLSSYTYVCTHTHTHTHTHTQGQ